VFDKGCVFDGFVVVCSKLGFVCLFNFDGTFVFDCHW
jgi:hypothetical protein